MSETMEAYDRVREVLPGRLWQSGSRVASEHWPTFDAVVAVGNGVQPWIDEWMEAGWKRCGYRPPAEKRLPVFVHAPLIDARQMLDEPTAEATARFVLNLLGTGRKVLIHCDAGVFRSVFVAALVVAVELQCPGWKACGLVKGRAVHNGIGIPEYDAMLQNWPPESLRRLRASPPPPLSVSGEQKGGSRDG